MQGADSMVVVLVGALDEAPSAGNSVLALAALAGLPELQAAPVMTEAICDAVTGLQQDSRCALNFVALGGELLAVAALLDLLVATAACGTISRQQLGSRCTHTYVLGQEGGRAAPGRAGGAA